MTRSSRPTGLPNPGRQEKEAGDAGTGGAQQTALLSTLIDQLIARGVIDARPRPLAAVLADLRRQKLDTISELALYHDARP